MRSFHPWFSKQSSPNETSDNKMSPFRFMYMGYITSGFEISFLYPFLWKLDLVWILFHLLFKQSSCWRDGFKNPSYWQSSGRPELNMNPELRLLLSLKALKVYFLVLQQKSVGKMHPLCSAYFTEEKVRPRAVEGFDPRSQNERTERSVNGRPTENLIFNN